MPTSPDPPQYTFGDSDAAAARLDLVAAVFEAPSRRFLAEQARVIGRRTLAVDLGCGPGHTTRLLADVVAAERTVGLDESPRFVSTATERFRDAHVEFAVHDVKQIPFPTGAADVIYARLVLAHFPEPEQFVTRWASQLAAGGRLLLDEIEWIRTTNDVLARYEEIVVALVASRQALMYAGPRIGALDGVASSVVETYPVATADAARMFAMNLDVWRHDEFIRSTYPSSTIDHLGGELRELCESDATDEIVWGLRQVAVYPASHGSH